MLDTYQTYLLERDVKSTDENYWKFAYKLKLEVWLYLIYEVNSQDTKKERNLLIPDYNQLEFLISSNLIVAKSIYLVSPRYVNKSSDWKLHKVLQFMKANSNMSNDSVYQCVLEDYIIYVEGVSDGEDESTLKFETLYKISDE